MKKYLNKDKLFFILLIGVLSFGCKREDKLTAELEPGPVFDTSTSLGAMQKAFFEKYDVVFDYEWDRAAFARNAVADPANKEDVQPYMEVLEEIYFKAMAAVSNATGKINFVQKQAPLTIFLIGSGINYGGSESFGEATVGQAGNIQPNRLTLGGLNEFGLLLRRKNSDAAFLDMIYNRAINSFPSDAGLIGFVYHEYTHYIDSKLDIPSGFEVPSATNYLRGTDGYRRVTETDARKVGFFIPYGMQNEHEDFATYVQIMVWKSPALIKTEYLLGPQSTQKYEIVDRYYKNLGLPLDELRKYLTTPEVRASLLAIKKKYE